MSEPIKVSGASCLCGPYHLDRRCPTHGRAGVNLVSGGKIGQPPDELARLRSRVEEAERERDVLDRIAEAARLLVKQSGVFVTIGLTDRDHLRALLVELDEVRADERGEWVQRMADAEDKHPHISVGGLAADMGMLDANEKTVAWEIVGKFQVALERIAHEDHTPMVMRQIALDALAPTSGGTDEA